MDLKASVFRGLGSLWGQIRQQISLRWPSVLRDPNLAQIQEYHVKKDPAENRRTEPPPDEKIELNAMWMVEFYPPSTANALASALRALGWDRDDSVATSEDPVRWLRHIRQRQVSGAWLNLGVIARPGDRRMYQPVRRVALPEGVDYAVARVCNVTSSLTCIITGFVFNDRVSLEYDNALRLGRATFLRRRGRGYAIYTPSTQKKESVRGTRQELRARCADWFRENLPGAFASGLLRGQFPSCEFISLHSQTPFAPKPIEGSAPEYMHLLGIAHDFEAWIFDESPAFRVGRPVFVDEGEEFHFILAVKHEDVPDDLLEAYGGRTRGGFVHYLDGLLMPFLVLWGMTALIEGYERIMNRTRDALPPAAASVREAMGTLNFLSGALATSPDILAVSLDVTSGSDRSNWFRFEPTRLKRVRQVQTDEDELLLDLLANDIIRRLERLRAVEESRRALLSQYAAAQSTLVNLRLQKHVMVLTWLMLGIAGVTLIIELYKLMNGP